LENIYKSNKNKIKNPRKIKIKIQDNLENIIKNPRKIKLRIQDNLENIYKSNTTWKI